MDYYIQLTRNQEEVNKHQQYMSHVRYCQIISQYIIYILYLSAFLHHTISHPWPIAPIESLQVSHRRSRQSPWLRLGSHCHASERRLRDGSRQLLDTAMGKPSSKHVLQRFFTTIGETTCFSARTGVPIVFLTCYNHGSRNPHKLRCGPPHLPYGEISPFIRGTAAPPTVGSKPRVSSFGTWENLEESR